MQSGNGSKPNWQPGCSTTAQRNRIYFIFFFFCFLFFVWVFGARFYSSRNQTNEFSVRCTVYWLIQVNSASVSYVESIASAHICSTYEHRQTSNERMAFSLFQTFFEARELNKFYSRMCLLFVFSIFFIPIWIGRHISNMPWIVKPFSISHFRISPSDCIELRKKTHLVYGLMIVVVAIAATFIYFIFFLALPFTAFIPNPIDWENSKFDARYIPCVFDSSGFITFANVVLDSSMETSQWPHCKWFGFFFWIHSVTRSSVYVYMVNCKFHFEYFCIWNGIRCSTLI